MSYRVAIAGFMHESHSFSPRPTTYADFVAAGLHRGEEILPAFANTRTELCAFADEGQAAGWEVVPLLQARTTPGGLVTADAYASLSAELLDLLRAAMPVDGLLLSLHGAMGVVGLPDPEGDLLSRIRAVLGPDVPVIVTLDMHANLTDAMVENASAIVGYRTYPHVDQYERGVDGARLMAGALSGSIRPVMVRVSPPALLTSMNMRTAAGPMADLVRMAEAVEQELGILSANVFGGYPYADFGGACAAAVVVADGDRSRAEEGARRLARAIWEHRHEFTADLLRPEQAITETLALQATGRGPIALVDVTDNTASGGTGDTTGLLAVMLQADLGESAFGMLWDPESVQAAIAAGVGAEVNLRLGGKSSPEFGGPVSVAGRVITLSDGVYRNQGPMNQGMTVHMGRTAVIRVGRMRVVITEQPVAPYDPEAFRCVGIDPAGLAVMGIKAKNHFRAAYSPFLRAILDVNAPGLATLDLTQLPYQQMGRPVWPLDPELQWEES